jgi:nitrogen fixation NifU-like protein
MYGDKVKQLVADLPNCGRLSQFTHSGKSINPVCGDEVEIFLQVQNKKIIRVGYLVSGCAGSTAAIAGLSELLKNNSVNQTMRLDKTKLLEYLGGLPRAKQHGVDLALEALKLAL